MSQAYCDKCFDHKPLDVYVKGVCEACRGADQPACECPERVRIRALALIRPDDVTAYHLLGRPERDRNAEEQGWLARYLERTRPAEEVTDGVPQHVAGAHVGTEGSRVEALVRCVKVVELEPGDFGRRFLCKMERQEDQADIVWFTGEGLSMYDNGEYTIRGTVKKHEVYLGRKQTVVQRVKVLQRHRLGDEEPDPNAGSDE